MEININLIRECKQNNKDAFNTLLAQYEGILFKICYSYTRNKEESLDIMQEVYIKIFRSIQSFDEKRPFLPWLKRITINTCLNHKRDTAKNQIFSIDKNQEDHFSMHDTICATTNVEETVFNNESQQIINQAIMELPDQYKMAISLRYLEDLSYIEIAKLTNQPLGTVKSNIFRGRDMLKKKLLKYQLLEV